MVSNDSFHRHQPNPAQTYTAPHQTINTNEHLHTLLGGKATQSVSFQLPQEKHKSRAVMNLQQSHPPRTIYALGRLPTHPHPATHSHPPTQPHILTHLPSHTPSPTANHCTSDPLTSNMASFFSASLISLSSFSGEASSSASFFFSASRALVCFFKLFLAFFRSCSWKRQELFRGNEHQELELIRPSYMHPSPSKQSAHTLTITCSYV